MLRMGMLPIMPPIMAPTELPMRPGGDAVAQHRASTNQQREDCVVDDVLRASGDNQHDGGDDGGNHARIDRGQPRAGVVVDRSCRRG